MIKNILFLLCMTLGLTMMQSCIKKKETPAPTTQRQAAKKKGGMANQKKKRVGQQNAGSKQAMLRKKAAGKPLGYWPALRKHLGIDANKLQKLKASEAKRVATLAKPGAKAAVINAKYNEAAKTLLGPDVYAKMTAFKMK